MSSVYPTQGLLPEQLKDDPLPEDIDIPDNYVQYTLKKEKSLPPVRWENLLNELNWLNVIILCATPIIGVIGVYFTHLQWKTAAFAAFYYYMTGLGTLALLHLCAHVLTHYIHRYHCRLP